MAVSSRPEPAPDGVPAVAELQAVTREHAVGRRRLRSLDAVSLRVAAGEVLAVTGPSGSGKTTLLHLIGGLDRPDAGHVRVLGTDWHSLRATARARFRRRHCGFVLQGEGLLPQATAAENVEVPLLLAGLEPLRRRERVAECLAALDLAGHATKLPDQLSGGQQQRIAIARALACEPRLVLADEPTGSLDSATAQLVVEALLSAARRDGCAVVLVTHDPAVASRADRVLRLRSGRLEGG